jgi:hypothetical protein
MRRDALTLTFVGSLALVWGGCNAVFGIEPLEESVQTDGEAALDDSGPDAAPHESSVDAVPYDSSDASEAGLDAAADSTAGDVGNDTTALCAQPVVSLRSAASFAVLAGSTVTSTGATSLTGDLGVSPGTAVTGFPPATLSGALEAGNATAAMAMADLGAAYLEARARTSCALTLSGDLGGRTLTAGLYRSATSMDIASGDLTLDAQGDADAVFVFQMATTLGTAGGRRVVLTNGARAANVFWQVGTSATLATMSVFQGTILADQSITLNGLATLNGRALARAAAVTLDGNAVVRPSP